ncbi:MAG: VaFE repeat-containing surface-anchored protein [Actinomycetaceae bacterium]|nr:VaFE repeat-containing surface-anchored protein [Actinomycetaceae bacterium]
MPHLLTPPAQQRLRHWTAAAVAAVMAALWVTVSLIAPSLAQGPQDTGPQTASLDVQLTGGPQPSTALASLATDTPGGAIAPISAVTDPQSEGAAGGLATFTHGGFGVCADAGCGQVTADSAGAVVADPSLAPSSPAAQNLQAHPDIQRQLAALSALYSENRTASAAAWQAAAWTLMGRTPSWSQDSSADDQAQADRLVQQVRSGDTPTLTNAELLASVAVTVTPGDQAGRWNVRLTSTDSQVQRALSAASTASEATVTVTAADQQVTGSVTQALGPGIPVDVPCEDGATAVSVAWSGSMVLSGLFATLQQPSAADHLHVIIPPVEVPVSGQAAFQVACPQAQPAAASSPSERDAAQPQATVPCVSVPAVALPSSTDGVDEGDVVIWDVDGTDRDVSVPSGAGDDVVLPADIAPGFPIAPGMPTPIFGPTVKPTKPTVKPDPKPTTEQPKPTTEQPKPTTEQPKPTTEQPKPTTEQPKPTTEQPKPTTEQPKPTTEQPKPTTEQPKPDPQPQPTPRCVPVISTSAIDAADNDKLLAANVDGIVRDTVTYTDFAAGDYAVVGNLVAQSSGKPVPDVTQRGITWIHAAADHAAGSVPVELSVPAAQAQPGETMVVYEWVYRKADIDTQGHVRSGATPYAFHTNIKDAAQTVVVAKAVPVNPKPDPKPSTDQPKPTTDQPKPKPSTDQPKPKPTTDQPKPTTDQPKPKPTTDQPKPTTDQPKPKPTTDQPKPTTDQPKPTTDQPKPTTDQPKPTTDQPKPTADQPKPKPSTDQPKPKPSTDQPKPKPKPTSTETTQVPGGDSSVKSTDRQDGASTKSTDRQGSGSDSSADQRQGAGSTSGSGGTQSPSSSPVVRVEHALATTGVNAGVVVAVALSTVLAGLALARVGRRHGA